MIGKKPVARVPTLADIEQYCRDDESSGCDLDMLDALRAAENAPAKPVPAKTPRWSAEIDDAVFKTSQSIPPTQAGAPSDYR